MEGALRLMDVPPDDMDSWLAAQAEAEAKRQKASGRAAPVPLASSTPATPAASAARAPQ